MSHQTVLHPVCFHLPELTRIDVVGYPPSGRVRHRRLWVVVSFLATLDDLNMFASETVPQYFEFFPEGWLHLSESSLRTIRIFDLQLIPIFARAAVLIETHILFAIKLNG